ncbi:ABC transporter ATP-binding protein [Streptosporangium sp. NPDC001559]|uniref:ABC transporter ATP-binding protein n=1 Tax=Streptosporangium sp. NPDC001559 TaxID=3366187 RepID=UPI0036EE81E2
MSTGTAHQRGEREVNVVEVEDLRVHFSRRRGVTVRAVDGVSFTVAPGETLGLAGESGSGKSTVARALLRITDPAGGRVRIGGRDIAGLRGAALKTFRRQMQMVYQDPYDSLDPRMRIGATVEEALSVRGLPAGERPARVRELLERVGLPAALATRYPHELSGGQRQRVSIARALGVDPAVIACDEAVSALDVSVRAQILNLLKDLQEDSGLAYLFISHDLSTMRFAADRIAIMYLGRLVEIGTRDQVFGAPRHPYTQALLAAVPVPGARRTGPRVRLAGEPPSPADPPAGCAFHPRCPLAEEICRTVRPELAVKRGGQLTACHLAPEPERNPGPERNPEVTP